MQPWRTCVLALALVLSTSSIMVFAPDSTGILGNEWFAHITGFSESAFERERMYMNPEIVRCDGENGIVINNLKTNRSYTAGLFSVHSAAEWEKMVNERHDATTAEVPLDIYITTSDNGLDTLEGTRALSIHRALAAAPQNSVFQVATCANGLEFRGIEELASRTSTIVTDYYVKGGRSQYAAMAAGAGTIARLYHAFDDNMKNAAEANPQQTYDRQVCFLDAFEKWFRSDSKSSLPVLQFTEVKVGYQRGTQLIFKEQDNMRLIPVPPKSKPKFVDQVLVADSALRCPHGLTPSLTGAERNALSMALYMGAHYGTYASAVANRRDHLYLTTFEADDTGKSTASLEPWKWMGQAVEFAHGRFGGHLKSVSLQLPMVSLKHGDVLKGDLSGSHQLSSLVSSACGRNVTCRIWTIKCEEDVCSKPTPAHTISKNSLPAHVADKMPIKAKMHMETDLSYIVYFGLVFVGLFVLAVWLWRRRIAARSLEHPM